MDQSLDDFAKSHRREGRGGRGGNRRGGGGRRDERQVDRPRQGAPKFGGGRGGKERRRGQFSGGRLTPFSRHGAADSVDKWGHEGFDALQRQPSPPRQIQGDVAYKVKVTNLHYDVIEDDLLELFGSVGEVLSAKVKYDASSRSTGEATVLLKSASSVQKAIDEFDGRAIDNQKMKVEEDGTVEIGEKKRAPKPDTRNRGEEDPRPRGRGFSSGTRGLLGEFVKDNEKPERRNEQRNRGGRDRFNDDDLKNLKVQVTF